MADEPTISQEPTDDPQRQRRFEAVLGGYFEALEAGQSPDRQELLASHPDLAAELAEFFAEQDRFHRLVAPLRPESTEPGGFPIGPPRGPPDPHSGDSRMAATPPPEPGSGGPAETQDHPSAGTDPRGWSTDQPAETRDSSAPARANGDPATLPRGTKVRYFGDYKLLKPLGRGGMGVVYRARQRSLNRLVALKMIRTGRFASVDELRRFHNEAEVVATLDHPHIVPIYEVGQHRRHHYFSMKLVPGGSLADRLDDYAADPRAAARLVATAARAVHHAHQRGILHRDLKPANILVDDHGQPHVTDFGLARRVETDSGLTQSGAVVGTPSYMAPEQTSGQRGAVTTAADVYGLGAILYALLTGQPPFHAEDVLATLTQVREREPEPPRGGNRKVDRDLAGEPILARPVGLWERGVKWARRRPLAVVVAACLLVAPAAVAGSIGWAARDRAARQAEAAAREDEKDRE